MPSDALERLRRDARELCRAYAAGAPGTRGRVRATLRDLPAGRELPLDQAQRVIALEHGFSSWQRLKERLAAGEQADDRRLQALVEAALVPADDHRSGTLEPALALLESEPGMGTRAIHVAAMLGEVEAVAYFLERDPASAGRPGGPRDWPPLLYLCFSRFLRLDPERAPRMVRVTEMLLAHGADPGAHWLEPAAPPGTRESALYGAAGIAGNLELTRLLLQAGADPNDGETPYHAAEHDGVPAAELLFSHGLDALGRSVMLRHKIDYDDLPGVGRLLELGADPNRTEPWGRTALHQAVLRCRPREWFELLLAHGADAGIPDSRGRTPYACAARAGQREIMETLRELGAPTELAPLDALLAACAAGDLDGARRRLAADPTLLPSMHAEDRAAIVEAAAAGNAVGVRTMLDVGLDIHALGPLWGETAAHRAAIVGHLETVRLLVERGTSLAARDRSYDSTPLGWAEHGGHDDVVRFLLGRPEALDLRDAVEHGLIDRVHALLGATDPDRAVRSAPPGALLRTAARRGHLEVVRLLLGKGARPELVDREGRSAVDHARSGGHHEIAALLREAAGRTG